MHGQRHCADHKAGPAVVIEEVKRKPTTRSDLKKDEFLIEKVLERRLLGKKKKRVNVKTAGLEDYEYLVSWIGYDSSYNSWIPYDSFFDASAVEERFPGQARKGPPCGNVIKDKRNCKNRCSAAVATANWPCGVFLSFGQIFRSESCTQVLLFLVSIMICLPLDQLKVLCYDDMCHLAPFIWRHREKGAAYAALAALLKYIDSFHFPNHISPSCIRQYNPANEPLLQGVNTESCEQENKWLNRCRHTLRYMWTARFNFFLLNILHLHNVAIEKKNSC